MTKDELKAAAGGSPADPRAFVAALQAGASDRALGIAAAMLATDTPLRAQWQGVARFAANEGEWPVALAAIRQYVADLPGDPDRHVAQAAMLSSSGRVAEAVALLEPIVSAVPQHAGLQHLLGVALLELGQVERGLEHLRAVLRLRPGSGQTWLSLANARLFTRGDAEFGSLEGAGVAAKSQSPGDCSAWFYAYGKALDDLGEHDRAFAAFAEGARIAAIERPVDADASLARARQVVEALRRLASTGSRPAAQSSRAIFVTGKPRSGTTLVDRILESHPHVAGGGELNLLEIAERRARNGPGAQVRTRYLHLLDARFGHEGRIIDKSLGTSRMAAMLDAALPEAPVIWVQRDALDTAWSSFRTHFSQGLGWTFDLIAMARHHALEDWLHDAWQQARGPRLLTLRYADLIDAPATVIPRILSHAGLPDDPHVARFHENKRAVQTASVLQVRQPINRAGMGTAEAYRSHLEPYERSYEAARRELGLTPP